MSLRREIHASFEAITPPLGGMPERVVEAVLADKGRRRKELMLVRYQIPLTVVAAVLLVSVAAGAVLTWSALHNGSALPAGTVHLTPLQQLESRPLQIQLPKSIADCKSGPYNTEGSFGSGPVYGDGGAVSTTQWGRYYHNDAYTDTAINGPILIRARDLFKNITVVFADVWAAGPVVGSDNVDGQKIDQRTELVLTTSQASPRSIMGVPHKYVWNFTAGVPKSWSGSTGWQIDAAGFTEVFYSC